ncbi:MAG: APC family permease, partial [Candidatus Acidiferrales bacterium]
QKALCFAFTISSDIEAVHVVSETDKQGVQKMWHEFVEVPAASQGRPLPKLVILKSPYRLVLTPLVDYVLEAEKNHPGRQIAVLVPELVERHWYHYLLHDNRAEVFKALLLLKGNQRIVIINVPWYLTV